VCSWTDSRPGGIYAQRLDGNGLPKWLAGGVAVIPSLPVRTVGPPTIASDRASGAVVVNYTRFGSGPRMVCAERIDSSGVTGWVDTLDQTSELQQGNIRMVSSGPLVTTFSVYVHGGVFHYGAVSCVDTSGTILWQQNPFAQGSDILAVAGDNGGGVFLLASVSPVGGPFGFSVQHITGAGTTTWAGGGIDVDTTSSSSWPSDPVLIPDGAGGLIAAWQQDRSGSIDIFAQRVDVSGALPIRLSAFAAKTVAPGSIQLTWTTLTEVNCYGFDIQKAGAGSQAYRTVPGSFTPGEGTTLLAHAYAFTDLHAEPGTWLYRLEEIDRDGTRRYSEPVLAADGSVPASFSLAQNYPNPFNPGTTIRYALPEKSHVTLSVFNALGQHVVTLLEETQGAGFHEVKFDGSGLPSGAYFYRVQAGGFSGTKKGLLIR